MFSSTALFKKITCPEISRCSLLNCIFSHQNLGGTETRFDPIPRSAVPIKQDEKAEQRTMDSKEDSDQANRPRKRRRLSKDETNEEKLMADSHVESSNALKLSHLQSNKSIGRGMAQASQSTLPEVHNILSTGTKLTQMRKDISPKSSEPSQPPAGLTKPTSKRKYMDRASEPSSMLSVEKKKSSEPVTQPPTANRPEISQEPIKEALNPRILPSPPASHTIRFQLLTLLHQYITKLNDQTKLLQDPSKTPIIMSPQQVITECLNQEEQIAQENAPVYGNVMRQRIMKYKRMTQEEWEIERFDRNPSPSAIPTVNPNPLPGIDTGLSNSDALAFLPRIYADRALISRFNYVTSAPTKEEMEAASQGVEAAHNWEVCERCQTRFQVFPGRRPKDGLQTSGGQCRYHPGKACRLAKGEYGHSCCSQKQGVEGCQVMHTHVFKVSDAKRLAAIMPFQETPENLARLSDEAVSFDCEMAYTTLGLELIRLTAVSWPTGGQLVDVLVRPLGEILDFNSRFSGVWPEEYGRSLDKMNGLPLSDEGESPGAPKVPLPMVESPAEARALFFKFISPTTPLIGHALENDLKAIRIIHPCIVDTVLLFPHGQGLPKRNSLKVLSTMLLGRDIQSDFRGHDSQEDAVAAGDLVKVKIREVVKNWKVKGWKVEDGDVPPIETDINNPPPKSHQHLLPAPLHARL